MTIGERVSRLGEADAKRALLHMIRSAEKALRCDRCPGGCLVESTGKMLSGTPVCRTKADTCMDKILSEAMRSAEA